MEEREEGQQSKRRWEAVLESIQSEVLNGESMRGSSVYDNQLIAVCSSNQGHHSLFIVIPNHLRLQHLSRSAPHPIPHILFLDWFYPHLPLIPPSPANVGFTPRTDVSVLYPFRVFIFSSYDGGVWFGYCSCWEGR